MKLSGWWATCVSWGVVGAVAVAIGILLERDGASVRRLLLEPLVKRGLRFDRHVSPHRVVARPAQLRTGNLVRARLIGREPDRDRPAGYRVLLYPEVREEEAVDHVERADADLDRTVVDHMQFVKDDEIGF